MKNRQKYLANRFLTVQEYREDLRLSLDEIQDCCHGLACKSGWWQGFKSDDLNMRGAKIALMHSELSEALEGMRKGLKDDHLSDRPMEEVELADTIIRILDYAGAMDLDVAGALTDKLLYNQQREDHKPENRLKEGGKAI